MPHALVIRAEGSPFGTRLARVIRTLRDEGWNCDVLHEAGALRRSDATTTGRDLRAETTLYEFHVGKGRWHQLQQQLTGSGYFGSASMRKAIADRLAARHYDLIVVKDSPALGAVFQELDRAGRSNTPVICEMVEPRVAQASASLIRYGTWATRLSAYGRRILPRLRAVERTYLSRCDRVFVVCDEMKQWLIENYPVVPERVSVVQNVEILDVFDATHAAGVPPRRGTRVSFVGTFGPFRGVELLVEAAGMVRKAGRVGDFSLAIVGGSKSDMKSLQVLCRAHQIDDIVELVPYVPHALAMQWIKETDIGVIPHVDIPGMATTVPFKLFQYMAAGAACLVSDVGPLGRIVREVGSGVAFRPGSSTDLADKLATLLLHPSDARRMGQAGRARSEQRFRWEVESGEYVRYLASIQPAVRPSPDR